MLRLGLMNASSEPRSNAGIADQATSNRQDQLRAAAGTIEAEPIRNREAPAANPHLQ